MTNGGVPMNDNDCIAAYAIKEMAKEATAMEQQKALCEKAEGINY